ncbi:RNA-dependent RNA polymerase, eukaryotic-type [Kalmanozyma brasiliensis GHG001]|uniref:RNA-dependent RNA polymerase, eukaryotic-type n=1 Tax=Kalmanozyma brasiliensis (strain GHG001) TaxID=1365824 RepID=UPI002867B41D|nr:RNA-dependent RNA polymerase, eukaryotic-type [Kalmanozyma brasiliensis GHG001]EST06322.2 RNA-dependent RNA polymerase, eukaryotic-type [Kalmanozyma brasiliensis GHG001]
MELAFLRESLIRNELVGTSALVHLSAYLDRMITARQPALALRALKNLVPKLEARKERGLTEEQTHKVTNRLWDEACDEAVRNDSNGLLTFLDPSLPTGDSLLSPFLHIDVTPTRVLLSGPHWHMSNRVIRSYKDHWQHFARVTFTNESREGATTITPNYGFAQSETFIRKRVLSILKDGINVAGRHWDLLAWSSSSMSTHTVWFLAPFTDSKGRRVDANVIRASLGDFRDVIRSPALYGARLSQAFSATASTVRVPQEHVRHIPDIEAEKGKAHTDGVGQISPALMADVWESYVSMHGEHRQRKLLKATAPSAIQIRLGGSKGMLAVHPGLTGKVVCLRPSMLKFSSGHQDLEVANSSSRCLSAKLNRPLINALDDRGVNKDAFLDIQDEAMRQIDRARTRFNETAKLCSAFSLGTGCNLRTLFEKCHKAGLGAATVEDDSFLLVLAKAVTAAAFGDMKRKARIPVKGVTLLGIADEFSFLKEGEAFAQVETVEFGQVNRRILTGRKLIGRSPTIDPSDVCMIECRKPPPGHPLLQLRNVIVFNTCTRDQPLPRRLGGGDLDGDLYTIYEDERLFPQTRQPPGVFHDKVKELTLNIDCGPHQLAEFFADFMLNDFIGLVSHLHLRIADISELGSEDPRCKKLARLHSQATDFRKTGVAVARTDLPRMQDPIIPDFLVQSEEKREGKLTYASKRVLGHLYRAVSWDMTDTPSLDKNTDPETGLERVIDEEPPEMDDDELTEFGAEFNRLAEQQSQGLISSARATVGNGSATQALPTSSHSGTRNLLAARITGPAGSADSTNAAPWQFKDSTFPQLLQRINQANRYFLPALGDDGIPKDDGSVTAEGHRYAALFQTFTSLLRQMSRKIASYHPYPDKLRRNASDAETPMNGVYLVSEVYLLTGRLPWARVAKRTRTDRDNDLLDGMQSICTLLRKRLCRLSEQGAYDSAEHGGSGPDTGGKTETSLADSGGGSGRAQRVAAGVAGSSTSARYTGVGTAEAPIEVDSSDEESLSGVDSARSTTPRPDGQRSALRPVTNVIDNASSVAAQPVPGSSSSALKRKASQDIGEGQKRTQSGTPLPLQTPADDNDDRRATPTAPDHPISPASQPSPPPAPMLPAQDEFIRLDAGDDDAATVAEEDEGEEGELTAASAQNTVDSLWKACHFFCSPDRPRYSNVYGYNTFMITLTLHMLSMLETLKHLSRDQGGKRYYQRPRAVTPTPQNPEVKTEEDGFEEEEDYAEEDEMEYEQDPNYSLTEEAMRALNLGQAILADMPPNQLGFDG